MTRVDISLELDRISSLAKERIGNLPAYLQGDLGEIAYLTEEEKKIRHELIQRLMTDYRQEFCPVAAHERIMARISARKSAKRVQVGPTSEATEQYYLF